MKSPEEIVYYIDHWNAHALRRPEMYAATPEALEGQFCVFEDLRTFILEEPPSKRWQFANKYTNFLVENDFGSANFTSRNVNCGFADLVAFLKAYLISQNRLVDVDHGLEGLK